MSLHSPSRNSNSKKEKEEQLISFQTLITSQTNIKLNDAEKEQNHSSFSNRQESSILFFNHYYIHIFNIFISQCKFKFY